MYDRHHAIVLLAPQATVSEREAQWQALGIFLCCPLQIWDCDEVVSHGVMGHSEKNGESLGCRTVGGLLSAISLGERLDRVGKLIRLEVRQTKIHLQAGHRGASLSALW